jgi:N-glycosylase/DNA lyase
MEKYKAYEKLEEFEDGGYGCVRVKGVKDFDLFHVFESGQTFRWHPEEDGSYTGVVGQRVVNLRREGDDLVMVNCTERDFIGFWHHYFDMGRDYSAIKEKLSSIDDNLKAAIEFGGGLRIMKQDIWEMTLTFILSANNRIPMIKRAVNGLAAQYGHKICEFRGRDFYSIPRPEELAVLEPEQVRLSGVGFRDKYIVESSKMVMNGDVELEGLEELGYSDAKAALMKLPGVGDKVSDCVLLFASAKQESFPVDTWVRKVMEILYDMKGASPKVMKEFAKSHFQGMPGLAQQYLFFHARESKLK